MQEPQETLGQEYPLGKGMTTPSSIIAWKIPWMEGLSRLQSMGSQRGTQLSMYAHSHPILLASFPFPQVKSELGSDFHPAHYGCLHFNVKLNDCF